MKQNTEEWRRIKLGKVSASRIADLMAKTKSGYSASRKNYEAQLIVERLTCVSEEGYTNSAMQHGIDTEPQARLAYELETNNTVVQIGFVEHPSIAMSGCSPDGLVGDDGLVEIKCPNTATHIEYLISGQIPDKYIKQMMWQIICTERKWCDFVSFDPRLPMNLRLKIERLHFDNELTMQIEAEVIEFLCELEAKLDKLQTING